MTVIIFDARPYKRRHYEARRQESSYYRGNSGIGLDTARLFIAEGAQVAITGRDQKTLGAAVTELGPNARGYRADLTIAEHRNQLFAALAKDFGKLDIVFAKRWHLR
jgi:short-subunit dehydrogenase involved in D-alanine esterification of teichoic acids